MAAGPALLEGGNSSAITASGERHRFLQRPRGRRQPFPFAVLGFFFPQKIKRPWGRSPPVSSWTQLYQEDSRGMAWCHEGLAACWSGFFAFLATENQIFVRIENAAQLREGYEASMDRAGPRRRS